MKETTIIWEAPEFIPKERSSDWFWAVGIIACAVAVTSILFDNLLFAVLITLITITAFLFAKRTPRTVEVEISQSGIRIGENLRPYSLLHAFWIDEMEIVPHLLLRSSALTEPIVSIPIIGVNLNEIRNYLLEQLPEEEIEEPLSVKIMEMLGF